MFKTIRSYQIYLSSIQYSQIIFPKLCIGCCFSLFYNSIYSLLGFAIFQTFLESIRLTTSIGFPNNHVAPRFSWIR